MEYQYDGNLDNKRQGVIHRQNNGTFLYALSWNSFYGLRWDGTFLRAQLKSNLLTRFAEIEPFSSYSALKCHFRSRIKNMNVIFSDRVWWKIVYGQREKTWPAHISCLLPSPSIRMSIYTRYGLSTFFLLTGA